MAVIDLTHRDLVRRVPERALDEVVGQNLVTSS
jgi:hypothetical protein